MENKLPSAVKLAEGDYLCLYLKNMCRIVFLVFLFLPLCLSGQEVPAGKTEKTQIPPEKAGFFPLIPLIEAVYAGKLPWGPDWIPNFPPDGFSLSPAEVSALTLTVDGG
ncbi:MAG: hypothetical protein LBP42_01335, partial [Treponema sp.]|nr:hypothetical protein [Treponema sp.]